MVEPVQEDLQDCPAIGANSFEAGISQKVMVKEMPSQDMSHLRETERDNAWLHDS